MQQVVREITEMAERLETSGLDRGQGNAVIQAIAQSIGKRDRQGRRIDLIDAELSRRIGWARTPSVALAGTLAGALARGMWP